ncbi:MAG: hypothetical protein EPO42_03275 [Gallionellaceae bacterium]|nr:MAG: hypothetical protein EPO42_03275 [Gallionellaceae bacterium]
MSTKNLSTTGSHVPPSTLVAALRRLLRPLIKLLLVNGITYPFLSNLLKSLYVEIAREEFLLNGKAQTDSRISLLSGVHRKDVKRLGEESLQEQSIPPSISLGAKLVALWTSNELYLDENGRHIPLPRQASEGGAKSFEGLVSSVSKDIRSRVILDEWLRIGVAHVDGEDRVCLNTDAFIPENGYDEKAYYFGQNLHDHIAAGAHNLLGQKPPFLDRSVYYNKLTPESVAELAELSKKLGMQALVAVNKRAGALQQRDAEKTGADQRINFGVYYFDAEGKRPQSDK